MEDKTDISSENIIISQAKYNKRENIKKIGFIPKISKFNKSQTYSKMINIILFEVIFLLLPYLITANNLIEIRVNKIGYNQIFSDEYEGDFPSKILINEKPLLMINKIIDVPSLNHLIHLEWDNSLKNFSFMFSNLTSITSITMNFELQNDCNKSYMLIVIIYKNLLMIYIMRILI